MNAIFVFPIWCIYMRFMESTYYKSDFIVKHHLYSRLISLGSRLINHHRYNCTVSTYTSHVCYYTACCQCNEPKSDRGNRMLQLKTRPSLFRSPFCASTATSRNMFCETRFMLCGLFMWK